MLASFVLSLLAALPDALLALWLKLLGDGVLGHDPRLRAASLRSASACRRRRPGSCARSARACSGASATRSRSRSSRTSRGCRPRSRRSRTRSGPTTSTGSRCCATRCSCSTTCTCRCSRPAAGSCASASRSRCSMSIHPALALLAVFALPTVLTSTWRPAVERAAQERGAQANRLARHLFTIATTAPPGKEVRVTGIGARLVDRAARGVGALVRAGGRGALGSARVAHARVGGLRRGVRRRDRVRRRRCCARRRATCCSCSPPARGCRPTSARRSARSASCAASGWTARGASPGSRTTPRRSPRRPTCPRPTRCATGIRFEHVSFAYPGHRRASCSTTCR